MQGDVAKQGYCACVIDKLSNTVSTRDFARIARTRKATPRVVSAIRRATAVCGGTG
jgi:nicotinate-nucleotide pyrophosphorylase